MSNLTRNILKSDELALSDRDIGKLLCGEEVKIGALNITRAVDGDEVAGSEPVMTAWLGTEEQQTSIDVIVKAAHKKEGEGMLTVEYDEVENITRPIVSVPVFNFLTETTFFPPLSREERHRHKNYAVAVRGMPKKEEKRVFEAFARHIVLEAAQGYGDPVIVLRDRLDLNRELGQTANDDISRMRIRFVIVEREEIVGADKRHPTRLTVGFDDVYLWGDL